MIKQRSEDYYDVREQLAQHCSENRADYVVIGNFGRKGKKYDNIFKLVKRGWVQTWANLHEDGKVESCSNPCDQEIVQERGQPD